MVGGNDSRVYNGQSLVFDPTGQLLTRGKAFEEDVLLVDTARGQGAGKAPEPLAACVEEDYWRALVLGTRDFVRKCGVEKAIVAISGGMFGVRIRQTGRQGRKRSFAGAVTARFVCRPLMSGGERPTLKAPQTRGL